jgi:poly-beta-1,6-N-acetyl-D-glucosamine synthase
MQRIEEPPQYVLITPARDEAEFIGGTLASVVKQTILPVKWIIVSDGSTDGTDEIVQRYAERHPWIELVKMSERKERHFAGKAHAFNAGYERVALLNYDFIGSLDADISFEADYFAFLLGKFAQDESLGLAGTPFREHGVQYDYRFSRKEHVSGACQVFRRACFESIGGYVPLRAGAVDLVAVVTARMRGWKTETFTEMYCIHHRRMGSARHNLILSELKSGYGDYCMGVHPLWQAFRSAYQMTRKPFFIAGASLMAGYLFAVLSLARKPVSADFVAFRRKEQLRWLREYVRDWAGC